MKVLYLLLVIFCFTTTLLAQNEDALCGTTATHLLKFSSAQKKYQIQFVRNFDRPFCHYPGLPPKNSNLELIYFDQKHKEVLRKKLFFNHEIFYDYEDPKTAKTTGGVIENHSDLTIVVKVPVLPGKKYFSYEVKRLQDGVSVGRGKL